MKKASANSPAATSPITHVLANRHYWDGMAGEWVAAGERAWQQPTPTWGIWGLPEQQLQLLPESMKGRNAIELGCGTGYVSAWMARRGATVTAIDNSSLQLATAARLMAEHKLPLNLIHGNAEQVPCPDGAFDFAISEYGAAIWCDPYKWIPEAYRLLKPGGQLTFLGNHPLAMVCTPLNGDVTSDGLHRPYFGMHQYDWRNVEIEPGGVEFNLSIADWFELFQETGFDVLNYQELKAPDDQFEDRFSVTANWAKKWPAEQVWQMQKI